MFIETFPVMLVEAVTEQSRFSISLPAELMPIASFSARVTLFPPQEMPFEFMARLLTVRLVSFM